jgi:hypothetical protein
LWAMMTSLGSCMVLKNSVTVFMGFFCHLVLGL